MEKKRENKKARGKEEMKELRGIKTYQSDTLDKKVTVPERDPAEEGMAAARRSKKKIIVYVTSWVEIETGIKGEITESKALRLYNDVPKKEWEEQVLSNATIGDAPLSFEVE